MRMLFVGVNATYMNPTANLAPALLQAVSQDTTCYGPGFVSQEEIDLGILRWCELNGPFDAIIIGCWTPILVDDYESSIENNINFLQKFAVSHFQMITAAAFFRDIQESLAELDVPLKLYYGLMYDYYATSQSQIDKIEELGLCLISPNNQFTLRLEDLPHYVKLEPYYHKKKKRLTDAWPSFISNNPERVITATHFISPDEFSYVALAERKNTISVPGVAYHLRKEAIRNLRNSGYYNICSSYFSTLYKIANKLGLRVYGRSIPLKMFNFLFWKVLSSTKYVYTARGSFGTPVRKFFEIPAAGALLLCAPCLGYEELGFVDNEHYIEADPTKLTDVLNRVRSEKEMSQKIASAGRRLVASKHHRTTIVVHSSVRSI